MKRVVDAKHAQRVDSVVKNKHRKLETRLNQYLIYLSSLEQVHVETMGKNMDAHAGVSCLCTFCAKSGMTDVQEVINYRE